METPSCQHPARERPGSPAELLPSGEENAESSHCYLRPLIKVFEELLI